MDAGNETAAGRRFRRIRLIVVVSAILILLVIAVAALLEEPERRHAPMTRQTAPKLSPVEEGRAIVEQYRCSACHSIDGVGGHLGPRLNGVLQRKSKDAIIRWIESPNSIKPGTPMPQYYFSEEEIEDIVAYLGTLDSTSEHRP